MEHDTNLYEIIISYKEKTYQVIEASGTSEDDIKERIEKDFAEASKSTGYFDLEIKSITLIDLDTGITLH